MSKPDYNQRILSCNIVHDSGFPGPSAVHVVFENGEPCFLFSYYNDELTFTESELIGMTGHEALKLRRDRDVAYLRS
jgi:hypothetical protein